jgi:hypothetical protein
VKEIQKVPLRLELDPSWGKLAAAKNDAIAHAVQVTPSDPLKKYNLLVLVPNYSYADGGLGMTKVVLSLFLESGDKYKMFSITKDKVADFCVPGTAIISFDPEFETHYFWLQPPDHEKN